MSEIIVVNEDKINKMIVVDDDDLMLGADDFDQEDFSRPNIFILEDMSPQVKSGPDRIDGATAGMFMNSVSLEVVKSFNCIVCFKENNWVEWNERIFVQKYNFDDGSKMAGTGEMREDKKGRVRLLLPNGNSIVNTFSYTLLTIDADGEPEQLADFHLSGGRIKTAKNFNTALTSHKVKNSKGVKVRAPYWMLKYHFSVKLTKNNSGDTYHTLDYKFLEVVKPGSALYGAAKESYIASKEIFENQ